MISPHPTLQAAERTCPVTDGPCRAQACADVPCGRPVQTMAFAQLRQSLSGYTGRIPFNLPVRLIVNGIAHPVEAVWFEPGQDGTGAICIGSDPR
jgi:hypothetical protein